MKKLAAISMLLILVMTAIGAQESGPAQPDQTEIMIPELVLQVEELAVEEVRAVLPNENELALGQISLPLPGADELSVANLTFDVPLPGTVAAAGDGPSVFATGRLGAGTANRVIGELSIYKLGVDPRFRLGFAHEGLDGYHWTVANGYAEREAGSGFYAQSNTISAWVSVEGDSLGFESELSFDENENGLQNLSDSFLVESRTTAFSGRVDYAPDPLIVVTGDVDARAGARLQSVTGGADVRRDQEYTLLPAASARTSIRSLDLIFRTSYFFRWLDDGASSPQQDLDFTAGFEATLPWSLVIGGHAGVHWDFVTGLEYPWRASVQAIIGDSVEIGASGGYRVERMSLVDLWTTTPLTLIDADAGLANNSVWYGRADARWTGVSGFSLRSSVEFLSQSAAVRIGEYDAVEDEFPFDQVAARSLIPWVEAAWQPSSLVQFEAGWKGRFLPRFAYEPGSAITGAVRFTDRSEAFRADAELVTEFFPQLTVPQLGLSGSWTAGAGVEFVLELSDVLAPLMDDGRPVFGPAVTPGYPFIRPGFVASLFTRITL